MIIFIQKGINNRQNVLWMEVAAHISGERGRFNKEWSTQQHDGMALCQGALAM